MQKGWRCLGSEEKSKETGGKPIFSRSGMQGESPQVHHVLRCPLCGRRLQVPCVSCYAQSSGRLPSNPKALFNAR